MVQYSFKSTYYKESNRVYIEIPFNVWETCGKKGLMPAEIDINGIIFECKLLPKGNGKYVIPVNKDIFNRLNTGSEFVVKFNLLDQLKRINHNSPYNKDSPIRRIDSIHYLKQPQNGYCGQTCLAMLAGISVDEVIKIMKSTKWQASMSKVLETLDYYGIIYKKPIYTKGQKFKFPKCCIINARGNMKSHFLVYYEGTFYDPTISIMHDYQYEKIICYIEIKTP